jgi:hypothetical protein
MPCNDLIRLPAVTVIKKQRMSKIKHVLR